MGLAVETRKLAVEAKLSETHVRTGIVVRQCLEKASDSYVAVLGFLTMAFGPPTATDISV